MGVDPDGLEKTIKRYNDVYVKNQKDEDFGKTAVNLTKRIDQGPFWACYTGMTVHHTMGGLNTNVKAQVLDWTGAVIPRLLCRRRNYRRHPWDEPSRRQCCARLLRLRSDRW